MGHAHSYLEMMQKYCSHGKQFLHKLLFLLLAHMKALQRPTKQVMAIEPKPLLGNEGHGKTTFLTGPDNLHAQLPEEPSFQIHAFTANLEFKRGWGKNEKKKQHLKLKKLLVIGSSVIIGLL